MVSDIEAECLTSIAGEAWAFYLGFDTEIEKECNQRIYEAELEYISYRARMFNAMLGYGTIPALGCIANYASLEKEGMFKISARES